MPGFDGDKKLKTVEETRAEHKLDYIRVPSWVNFSTHIRLKYVCIFCEDPIFIFRSEWCFLFIRVKHVLEHPKLISKLKRK